MVKKRRIKQPLKRKIIQLMAALIFNANLKGFLSAEIYTGPLKGVCAPGLNCYSCPGAVLSCPLGALQNALSSANRRLPMYITGTLLLFGVILGRRICGFLCPFGLLQELIHKIPTPKLKKGKATRMLTWLKYVVLAVFVVLLPIYMGLFNGVQLPAFCKYICPSGTLFGGVLLVSVDGALRSLVGSLFSWKVCVMVIILVSSVFIYRSFCRFLCPLGAIYSFFAKICVLGIKFDSSKCTCCNACKNVCKMDIKRPGDRECISCGECVSVCKSGAIR